MGDTLETCPFCGGFANSERTVTDASVWCVECMAQGMVEVGKFEAAA